MIDYNEKIYPVTFEEDHVEYDVYFPDAEGTITQDKTLEEAMNNSSDVLDIMLADLIEKEEELPIPTQLMIFLKKMILIW